MSHDWSSAAGVLSHERHFPWSVSVLLTCRQTPITKHWHSSPWLVSLRVIALPVASEIEAAGVRPGGGSFIYLESSKAEAGPPLSCLETITTSTTDNPACSFVFSFCIPTSIINPVWEINLALLRIFLNSSMSYFVYRCHTYNTNETLFEVMDQIKSCFALAGCPVCVGFCFRGYSTLSAPCVRHSVADETSRLDCRIKKTLILMSYSNLTFLGNYVMLKFAVPFNYS